MENVKFVHCSKSAGKGRVDLYFRINSRIADYIRKYTKYSREELLSYLSDENDFMYRIRSSEDFDDIQESIVETIEKISNSGDDEFFFNHLITDNGHFRFPSDIHQLMKKEYGLADIDESEGKDGFKDTDVQIEWWVAHFFIALPRLLFDEPSDCFESSENNMNYNLDMPDVSEILSKLKSIDSIIIVDDVRDYEPEEIKELRDKLAKE